MPDKRTARQQTILDRITVDGNCWILGSGKDYGKVRFNGRNHLAHRFSYEAFVGPIPDDLTIDHLCRNHACVNPDHLEPVTIRENVLRGEGITAQNARKTHCPRGHEYTPENVYLKNGGRFCRACNRDARVSGKETHMNAAQREALRLLREHHGFVVITRKPTEIRDDGHLWLHWQTARALERLGALRLSGDGRFKSIAFVASPVSPNTEETT